MNKKTYIGLGVLFLICTGLIASAGRQNQPAVEDISKTSPISTTRNIQNIPDTQSTVVPATTPAPSGASSVGLYKVVKVIDGDTLTVSQEGVETTLRLIGINTPETVDPRKPVECFGKEASNKGKELLSGKSVKLEFDSTQSKVDKYGGTLAYVYRDDGLFYNKYMIEQGYAYEYTYDTPYKYQQEFKAAQIKAKSEQKGLWSPSTCNTSTQTITSSPVTTTPSQTQTPSSGYVCSYNAYNCADFATQAEAQATFEGCGGGSNDIHKLDGDKDGRVCEGRP